MGTLQLREELHKYIDQADDRILRLVKGMFDDYTSSEPMSEATFFKRNEESQNAIKNNQLVSQSEARAHFKRKHA